jgi:Zn-finger protein
MFCYCPLYLLDDCGGKYILNYGIKDCSDCIIPHRPNGYDYINKKITEVNDKKLEEYIKNNMSF